MLLPNTNIDPNTGLVLADGEYRYGFNGMEKDDEIKGEGNSYTTTFRQYDPRIGRWLSLDPKMAKYPHQSPYVAFDNNPIYFSDPFGDDPPEKEKVYNSADGGLINVPANAKVEFFDKSTFIVSGNGANANVPENSVKSFTLENGDVYHASWSKDDDGNAVFKGYKKLDSEGKLTNIVYEKSNVFNFLTDLYEVEGGYNNVEGDVPTNYGITIGIWKTYAKELGFKGTVSELKTITKKEASYIYLNYYWNNVGLDKIYAVDEKIAMVLFETTVNTWDDGFIMLKRALNEVEGTNYKENMSVNDDFIESLKSANREAVFNQFVENMDNWYKNKYDKKLEKENVKMGGWLKKMDKYNNTYK